ncbi:MAG TPA: DNA translocase FtsK 4TM domain-containing protein, partial [Candidatus Methylomirabilis sp.]
MVADVERRAGQRGGWAAVRAVLGHEKTHEVLGVLAAALALFSLAGLASFDPRDPSFFHVGVGEEARIHNWGGRLGAELAGDLLGLLGISALLVPPVLSVLAWMGIAGRRLPRQGVRAVALGILVPSLSLLASLLGDLGVLANGRVERPGGFLGDELGRQLHSLVGPAGLYLGAVTGLLVAGLLVTERRLTHLPLTPLQGVRRWPLLAAQRALETARAVRVGVAHLMEAWAAWRTPRHMAPSPAVPAGPTG